jgi:hypothetical protein
MTFCCKKKIYIIRRMTILELHQFDVVTLILFEHVELKIFFLESR